MQHGLFEKGDVVNSYKWLGHNGYGYTQLIAFHKDYIPGKEHFKHNLRNYAFPKIWYAKNAKAVLRFVEKFHNHHTCCYGVNPRPALFKNEKGNNRAAKEEDIQTVMNFFFDIDFTEKNPSDEQIAELRLFFFKTQPFFEDLDILMPMINFSGRGYHLVFSPEPILVREYPDIKQRLIEFLNRFKIEFNRDLNGLGAKLDNVMDLSRVVKIYGTKKPGYSRLSSFEGGKRIPDRKLKEYLLSLVLQQEEIADLHLPATKVIPKKFANLLNEDNVLRNLWEGTGKTKGDVSRTGYEFSLVKRCLIKGVTDIADLHAILALRPNGSIQAGSKGEQYIKITIANAIKE